MLPHHSKSKRNEKESTILICCVHKHIISVKFKTNPLIIGYSFSLSFSFLFFFFLFFIIFPFDSTMYVNMCFHIVWNVKKEKLSNKNHIMTSTYVPLLLSFLDLFYPFFLLYHINFIIIESF